MSTLNGINCLNDENEYFTDKQYEYIKKLRTY